MNSISPSASAWIRRIRCLLQLACAGSALCGMATRGQAQVIELDYGDAPDQPYPTRLASNGARHVVAAGFHLGARVDLEPEGQPNATATGDDAVPTSADDEDGVRFVTPLLAGEPAEVEITVTMPPTETARLDAWIDFNSNGSWADSEDFVFQSVSVHAGSNTLTLIVPEGAAVGATFARFRLTRNGFPRFTGQAPDGEVEDYQVVISRISTCDLNCGDIDFWLTFPGNYAPDPANPVELHLCLIGLPGTSGTVLAPGLGYTTNFTIGPSGTTTVQPPSSAELSNANDVIESKGIRVLASAPVSVQALNLVDFTSDGYVALPTRILGTNYIVQAFANVQTGVPSLNGSQFAIVASQPNTIVTITPSVTVGVHDEAIPYTITLQAGQTYQLRDTNDAPADLSGTFVASDKPIAVFGSHRCASVQSAEALFCDYLVEQLLPLQHWGQTFAAALFATRAGDTFRVLASQDNTHVTLSGLPAITLQRGQTWQGTFTADPFITADKPVFVTQYANSSDFDNVPNADPFMVVVPPTKLFNREHVVCTAPAGEFVANFLNIVAPAAAVGAVTVDGGVVGPFVPIAGSGFSGARVPVAPGTHAVQSPLPVGVTVYGWASFESYGFTGCFYFGDVTPPTITCPATDVTLTLNSAAGSCLTTLPDFRAEAQVSDNCGSLVGFLVTQSPPPGTAVGPGVHGVTLTATDASQNTASCFITVTVVDPSAPTILCPNDIVLNCAAFTNSVVTYAVTAYTTCITDLPVTCLPPSGSAFAPGVTTVSCTATNAGFSTACSFRVIIRCLTITHSDPGTVLIIWTGGGVLERSFALGGAWEPLRTAASPFQVSVSDQAPQFYRIHY